MDLDPNQEPVQMPTQNPEPASTQPTTEAYVAGGSKFSPKMILIIVGVIAGLVLLGVGGWFGYKSISSDSGETSKKVAVSSDLSTNIDEVLSNLTNVKVTDRKGKDSYTLDMDSKALLYCTDNGGNVLTGNECDEVIYERSYDNKLDSSNTDFLITKNNEQVGTGKLVLKAEILPGYLVYSTDETKLREIYDNPNVLLGEYKRFLEKREVNEKTFEIGDDVVCSVYKVLSGGRQDGSCFIVRRHKTYDYTIPSGTDILVYEIKIIMEPTREGLTIGKDFFEAELRNTVEVLRDSIKKI